MVRSDQCGRRGDTPQRGVPAKFALQTDANCGSLPTVRKSPVVGILLLAVVCSASAQNQEKKLVDRLLKPDMALQNDAQNKKFVGDGWRPSINAQTSDRFSFTRNRARKIFLGRETSPPRNFILRPTRAVGRPSRLRHSKH